MPEVEVCFRAVLGYENFAVLNRVHRPGIDVKVRIEFLRLHLVPATFQKSPETRRDDSLTESRNHAARYEYVLSHCFILRFLFLLAMCVFADTYRRFCDVRQ